MTDYVPSDKAVENGLIRLFSSDEIAALDKSVETCEHVARALRAKAAESAETQARLEALYLEQARNLNRVIGALSAPMPERPGS